MHGNWQQIWHSAYVPCHLTRMAHQNFASQYCFLLRWVAHHLLYQWFFFFLFLKNDGVVFFSVNYHPFQSDIPCQSQAMQLSSKRFLNVFTSGLQKKGGFFFFSSSVQFIYCLWLGESKISLHWSILAFELVFFFFKRDFVSNSNQALSALVVSLFLCVYDKHSNSRWIVQTLPLILV